MDDLGEGLGAREIRAYIVRKGWGREIFRQMTLFLNLFSWESSDYKAGTRCAKCKDFVVLLIFKNLFVFDPVNMLLSSVRVT